MTQKSKPAQPSLKPRLAMSDLARAERYRDQLHDLADSYTAAEEREIDMQAMELAESAFDKLDKESLRSEWLEAHVEDYRLAAIDQLGLT